MQQAHRRITRQSFRLAMVALAGTVLGAGTAKAQAPRTDAVTLPANLTATRAALDKYQDPLAAVRDGYFSTLGCVDYPKGGGGMDEMAYKPGGMGVHFINPSLIGPTLDSLKPQVLLYEPVGDKLRLVGAEWFAPVAVAKTAPTIFGQTLMGPMEGHPPIMPASLHHWDLHVWLWKDNPAGVFSPTNARVKCPEHGYGYSFDDEPPKVVRP